MPLYLRYRVWRRSLIIRDRLSRLVRRPKQGVVYLDPSLHELLAEPGPSVRSDDGGRGPDVARFPLPDRPQGDEATQELGCHADPGIAGPVHRDPLDEELSQPDRVFRPDEPERP